MINDFYVTRKKNLRAYAHAFYEIQLYKRFSFHFKTDLLNEYIQEFPTIIFNIETKEFEINLNNFSKILSVLTLAILPIKFNKDVKVEFLLRVHIQRHGIGSEAKLFDILKKANSLDDQDFIITQLAIYTSLYFVRSEALRCIIKILQLETLTFEILQTTYDHLNLQLKYIPVIEDHAIVFLTELLKLINQVLEDSIVPELVFDQLLKENNIDDYSKRLLLVKNSEILKILNYSSKLPELLKELGVNIDAYKNEIKSSKFKSFLKKIKCNSETNLFDCDFMRSDILYYDSNPKNYKNPKFTDLPFKISDQNVDVHLEKVFLYYYFEGLLTGLVYYIMTSILMKQNNNKINRVRNTINKEIAESKEKYAFLNGLLFYADENAHKNIIFIIRISHQLCLTQKEAWQLSKALGLNNYDSFKKNYTRLYERLYSNHTLIK